MKEAHTGVGNLCNIYVNLRVPHVAPIYPEVQLHTSGRTQVPPFKHAGSHTAKIKTNTCINVNATIYFSSLNSTETN